MNEEDYNACCSDLVAAMDTISKILDNIEGAGEAEIETLAGHIKAIYDKVKD